MILSFSCFTAALTAPEHVSGSYSTLPVILLIFSTRWLAEYSHLPLLPHFIAADVYAVGAASTAVFTALTAPEHGSALDNDLFYCPCYS